MKSFDVIVVGGGMVGAAMACCLRPNVALIDATPLNITDDHRLIALNHNSFRFFNHIGIWSALAPHAEAIQEVHVSQRGRFGATRLSASELNLPVLGYLVPAKEINRALYNKLSELKNVELIRPASVTELEQHETQVNLTVGNEKFSATTVIAADGTHSTIRELLQIPTEIIDYHQQALVTITDLHRHHGHVAYERFLSTGAIAMLPLNEKQVATIWTDNNETIAELMQLSSHDFLMRLQKEFGYRLGRLQNIHERYTYPLKYVKAKEQLKENVVLIGNAAHTVSPIAAQGLNLALYEVAWVCEQLNTFGKITGIKTMSVDLSHRLASLFSKDLLLVNTARQLGMLSLEICSPAKKWFANYVMGKTQQLPESMR